MPDLFDEASELEAELREKAVENTRRLAAPETHPDFDGIHCVDCGDPIHHARLSLGKVRCINCQEYLERMYARAG